MMRTCIPRAMSGFLVLVAFCGSVRAQDRHAHPTNVEPDPKHPVQTHPLTGEPYVLLGNRIYFTNWLFVRQGQLAWAAVDDGRNVSANAKEKIGDWGAAYRRAYNPHGIHLEVEPAQRRGPIIKREKPWEAIGVEINTLIEDGDRYRAWGMCDAAAGERYYCYFESSDGLQWERPVLNQVEFDGSTENNLISYPAMSVFIDPVAPAEERYKFVTLSTIEREDYEKFKKKHPDRWEPRADRGSHIYAMRGATSPDGLNWKWVTGIFNIEHSDTQIVPTYDRLLGKYVIYTRNYMIRQRDYRAAAGVGASWWTIGRRSIGRTESENFRRFPVSEVVLAPTPDMKPYELLYTNAYTTLPQAPDHHVMFPSVWDVSNDETDVRVATSHDGKRWQFMPGAPVLETNTFGQFDGGCVFARINLVELPDGDFVLPYTGYRYPHKYARGSWAYHTGYAVWPKGRLFALAADELGEFTAVGVIPPGKTLRINAVTTRAGSIRIEACDLNGTPLPGRSFDESVAIQGDQYNTVVEWNAAKDLGAEPNQPIMLRFKLDQARIYWLQFD